jgi:putative component of toxin-antitoxin plasmid stabilization module
MKPEYAEVLRWIADGKEVQFRHGGGSWQETGVQIVLASVCQKMYDDSVGKETSYEFRLKPEGKWYRVYLDQRGYTQTLDCCEGVTDDEASKWSDFSRWLTDRIYYE